MRLNRLVINNFRVIRRADLSFEDSVIGIVGPNGAGKSSLVEAVAWALFGNVAARTGRDQIKLQVADQNSDCRVQLEFEVDGQPFTINRKLSGKNQKASVELYCADKMESVGITETQNHIIRLLGLDWQGFLTSFLARQQELNALIDLQPAKRKDHLARMLGIEKIDNAIGRAKADNRDFVRSVELLSHQVQDKDELVRTGRVLQDKQAVATKQTAEFQQQVQLSRSQLEIKTTEYQNIAKSRDQWLQLRARLDTQKAAHTFVDERKKHLQKEVEELSGVQVFLDKMNIQLKALPGLKQEVQQLSQNQAKSTERAAEKARLDTDCQEQIRLMSEVEQLAGQEKDIQDEIKSLPEALEQKYKEQQEQLIRARDEYSLKKAALTALENDCKKLVNQLENIEQLGPESVCDRCLRPVGNDLDEIRRHFTAEMEQVQSRILSEQKVLADLRSDGERISEQEKKTAEQLKRYWLLLERLKGFQSNLKSLELSRKTVDSRIQTSQKKLQSLGETHFDEKLYATRQSQLLELEKLQAERDRLAGRLDRLGKARQEQRQQKEKLADIDKSITEIENQIIQLGFDEEKFRQAQSGFESARDGHDSCRQKLIMIQKELELAAQELEHHQTLIEAQKHLLTEIEGFRDNSYYGEKLVNLMQEYRKNLIASIRPTLSRMSSSLISDMTSGRYSYVQLDEEYNLHIMDNGELFEIDRFSGGEKDLANLCLRLAISRSLTETAGLDRSFIILDEVFGSQDTERRDLIVNALGNLKTRFPQVFLITHIEDLKDRVETLIEVRPTGMGYSEVRVVDGGN